MASPPHPDVLLRLRALRHVELAAAHIKATGLPAEEHRTSLTQVHDDVRAVLNRIDAAEAAMRPVLQAWAQDPARGGAHLLGQGDDYVMEPQHTQLAPAAPWPPAPQDDLLPDTVRPATPPTP